MRDQHLSPGKRRSDTQEKHPKDSLRSCTAFGPAIRTGNAPRANNSTQGCCKLRARRGTQFLAGRQQPGWRRARRQALGSPKWSRFARGPAHRTGPDTLRRPRYGGESRLSQAREQYLSRNETGLPGSESPGSSRNYYSQIPKTRVTPGWCVYQHVRRKATPTGPAKRSESRVNPLTSDRTSRRNSGGAPPRGRILLSGRKKMQFPSPHLRSQSLKWLCADYHLSQSQKCIENVLELPPGGRLFERAHRTPHPPYRWLLLSQRRKRGPEVHLAGRSRSELRQAASPSRRRGARVGTFTRLTFPRPEPESRRAAQNTGALRPFGL